MNPLEKRKPHAVSQSVVNQCSCFIASQMNNTFYKRLAERQLCTNTVLNYELKNNNHEAVIYVFFSEPFI